MRILFVGDVVGRAGRNAIAEHLPGTVGFVIPDRFHLVYLEFARAANALGLHESTGSRIAMASTAAGFAYTAALDADVGDALVTDMEREMPEAAKLLRSRIEASGMRTFIFVATDKSRQLGSRGEAVTQNRFHHRRQQSCAWRRP